MLDNIAERPPLQRTSTGSSVRCILLPKQMQRGDQAGPLPHRIERTSGFIKSAKRRHSLFISRQGGSVRKRNSPGTGLEQLQCIDYHYNMRYFALSADEPTALRGIWNCY